MRLAMSEIGPLFIIHWRTAVRFLGFLILFAALAPGASSADVIAFRHGTLRVVLSQSGLVAGGSAKLALVLSISDGYHAQSNAPLDPSLIPAALKIDADHSLRFGQVEYPVGKHVNGSNS
jgi:hypothetical protein